MFRHDGILLANLQKSSSQKISSAFLISACQLFRISVFSFPCFPFSAQHLNSSTAQRLNFFFSVTFPVKFSKHPSLPLLCADQSHSAIRAHPCWSADRHPKMRSTAPGSHDDDSDFEARAHRATGDR